MFACRTSWWSCFGEVLSRWQVACQCSSRHDCKALESAHRRASANLQWPLQGTVSKQVSDHLLAAGLIKDEAFTSCLHIELSCELVFSRESTGVRCQTGQVTSDCGLPTHIALVSDHKAARLLSLLTAMCCMLLVCLRSGSDVSKQVVQLQLAKCQIASSLLPVSG